MKNEILNENYYVGLDIGTNSVGYAVTDEQYHLCKFKGEPMWGVTLFEEANLAAERRAFRTARRRLDRRQQRVFLVQELFAEAIAQNDENFFKRIQESRHYPESQEDKVRLFDTYEAQKQYTERYPTIHHLIVDLMESKEPHDVRLVYLACAWLVAHRGHFLLEVRPVGEVTDFQPVYDNLKNFLKHDDYDCPWDSAVDLERLSEVLKEQVGSTRKKQKLTEVLFGSQKVPNTIDEAHEFNYAEILTLLSGGGGKGSLKKLFGKDSYDDLEEKSFSLGMDDETLQSVLLSVDDSDAELLRCLKAVYDWSVLADILQGHTTISAAKVAVYHRHEEDLQTLKDLVRSYLPKSDYDEIFRKETHGSNYVAYIGKHKAEKGGAKKPVNQEAFCEYLFKEKFKSVTPREEDEKRYRDMQERLKNHTFMPKQVNGDNRVIPHQLYERELKRILENAKTYLPFLNDKDEDGITVEEKVLSVFTFRVPYYVGPLQEKGNPKQNHWMVRRAQGKILPWNFDRMVDKEQSEEAFISRMTNTCTYLPGEDVLPKQSLRYCAFEVLNEINLIKINGQSISVEAKQSLYNEVFLQYDKVTRKRIVDFLKANNLLESEDELSGLDITVKSSLKPFHQFKKLTESGALSASDAEAIIRRATYSEERSQFSRWLKREYSRLPEEEICYLAGLKFKDFGRLSKQFLCKIPGVNRETGEAYSSILNALWETNDNLQQLLSERYTFGEAVEQWRKDYFAAHPQSLSERLEEMRVSNAVKRPIIRTLDILKDVEKIRGREPAKVFVEMARGGTEDRKGKRTDPRLTQIQDLYKQRELYKQFEEEVRELQNRLDQWGDEAHNRLQSDKIFLYFMQLGRCMYTGHPISLDSVVSGDGDYNIEHIYPRSAVKDDSVLNNKVLVESQANGAKSDRYPIDPTVQATMGEFWKKLKENHAITEEKYRRLTRKTPFTEEERFDFVNRQLVETRQSTKALATLLKERYPNAEIVYVKAGLVSDFRQAFELFKSRQVNDLHHAKDAYLNIAVGNVWNAKFSKRYWLKSKEPINVKPEVVFTHEVRCGNDVIWNGAADKNRVVSTAQKNTAHLTVYAFCRHGGFFDQNPVSADSCLTPLKQGLPTERYGGYKRSAATFFVLVRYKIVQRLKAEPDVMIMPVELLHAKRFLNDEAFALAYAKRTIAEIKKKQEDEVQDVAFLLNKRILKVNTVLSLNGFRMCITGKAGGGTRLGVSGSMAFKTSPEQEAYIKRLESFAGKTEKNDKLVFCEAFDKLSKEKNLALYDLYTDKWQHTLYRYRPNGPLKILTDGREAFQALNEPEQAKVLLEIQGLFGREKSADLRAIGGDKGSCEAKLSSSLSNWKKTFTDVRIVDLSASGLFESVSDNLLDLL